MKYFLVLLLIVLFSCTKAQNNYMLSFDLTNSEFASVTTTAINHQTGFFSLWMVIDNLTTFYFPIAFARTDLATTFVRLDTRDNGKLRITQRNGDTQDQVESNGTITAGSLNHIVFGSNGSAFLMWINGTSQTLSVIGGADNGDWLGDITQSGSSQAFSIGVKIGNPFAGYFPGDLDEIVYSSTAPTQTIVDDIYNSGTPKDETNASLYTLVHYWRLEEGTGQTAADSKGSLNMTLGIDSEAAEDDPTWTASVFGWPSASNAFKAHSSYNKFKGF